MQIFPPSMRPVRLIPTLSRFSKWALGKPHITLMTIGGGLDVQLRGYVCKSPQMPHGPTGYGKTPEEAFESYELSRAYMAKIARCDE